jgi:DNA-directed RNA polymerase specialized sigma24 family protein
MSGELTLITRVLAGATDAWQRFVQLTAAAAHGVVCRYYPAAEAGRETRNLYLALQADDCAILRRYRGVPVLVRYIALEADRLLSLRLVDQFRSNARQAWPIFERRFEQDIKRAITRQARGLAATHSTDDLYQEFCTFLVEQDYRPITLFRGEGEASFAWYLIARVVRRWCIDQGRAPEAGGRWRMPQAILALDELAQRVFKLLDHDRATEAEVFRRLAEVPRVDVEAALDRVFKACAPGSGARQRVAFQPIRVDGDGDGAEELQVPTDDPTPEQALLAQEQTAMVAQAINALPVEEKLIIELWLKHDDLARVATLSGRDIKQVRIIKERALRRLQRTVGEKSP